jgi:hypothetical protein
MTSGWSAARVRVAKRRWCVEVLAGEVEVAAGEGEAAADEVDDDELGGDLPLGGHVDALEGGELVLGGGPGALLEGGEGEVDVDEADVEVVAADAGLGDGEALVPAGDAASRSPA